MRRLQRLVRFFVTASLTAFSTAALATPPRSPILLNLKVEGLEHGNLSGQAILEVVSTQEARGTTVWLILPPGMEAEKTEWTVDLEVDVPVSLTTRWSLTPGPLLADGNVIVSAKATHVLGEASSWGDVQSIPFHVEAAGVPAAGWRVDRVPVSRPGKAATALVVSEEALPFQFDDLSGGARDESWIDAPARPPLDPRAPAPAAEPMGGPPAAAGTVTLTGAWMYPDRSGVPRPVDQQYIEIRKGDGTPLSPRVFCFTQVNGGFSCSFTHPGTTMRVWLRSATNLTPGPTRLGVFSGIEVSGGCGSDSIDCTYANTSAAVSCPDGTTCSLGTMTAAGGEPWIGAHQMTQDLIRSWKKILFDAKHPAGTHSGPAKITYPTPPGHGPHAHVFDEGSENSGDPWISIPAPFQTAADVVAHEYGHAVMDNIWQSYTPSWAQDDCPASHALGFPSGYGCALSEGFADYWSWYSNEFYDGDSDPNNDGPVYNDPSFSSSFETRDEGGQYPYLPGANVEGNVAGALGDMMDAANDGAPSCQGTGDRLSDGIQHIWHTFYSGSSQAFAGWFNAYWAVHLHPKLPALETIHHNGIDFGFPANDTCPGAQEITTLQFDDIADTTLTSCVEPGEPAPTCGNGSNARSVYYHWTAPGAGMVTVSTAASDYDTILSAWSGSCGALTSLACNDDTPGSTQSQLVMGVSGGQSITFMVSSYDGSGGDLSFHLDFQPASATNDACGSPTVITATPFTDAVDASGATSDPADPNHDCTLGGFSTTGSVFYRWTAPADGTIRADTFGSNYDTILSAYLGTCGAFVSQACDDDNTGVTSRIAMPVTEGMVITFMISSVGALPAGTLVFHLEFSTPPPANDTCAAAKVMSSFPYVDTINTYGAAASGGDPPPECGNQSSGKSVWYEFTAPSSGLLTVDTFGSLYDTILSTWTGACGALTALPGGCNDDALGTASRVQFFVTQGTTYRFEASAYHNDGGRLVINADFAPNPPPNDPCGGATIVNAWPWVDAVYTGGATTDPGEPPSPCGNGSAARSAWYRFTAPVSGTLLLDTAGSSYDTILSVWTGGCAALAAGACNDDAPGGVTSFISLPVSKGVTYHVRASSYDGSGGTLQFALQFYGSSGHVPDGWAYPGQPLDVADAGGGQVRLTWGESCFATDTDYDVYEGRIGSYYSHVPVYCSTGGLRDVTFPAAPFDAYYVVAPRNDTQEGSHGLTSAGVERDVAGLTCLSQSIAVCSPACAHDICAVGAALDPACSDCVAQICAGDPDCCVSGWDAGCAGEAQRSCSQECP